MKRNTVLAGALCLMATLSLFVPASSLAQQAAPVFKSEQLVEPAGPGPSAYRLWIESSGAQLGPNLLLLATAGGGVLVDTHFAHPYIGQILTGGVSKLLAGAPLRQVVATHYHPDHTGGIGHFSGDTSVLAHENVRRTLADGTSATGLVRPGERIDFPARSADGLPDTTFRDAWALDVGGEHVRVVHLPHAHTDGDAVVVFEQAGIVAVGDLIWPGEYPSIDVDNGGTATGLAAAVKTLLDTMPAHARFVTGHGRVLDQAGLQAYHNMLASTIQHVRARLADGARLDAIVKEGLPAAWSTWASDLVPEDVWIRTIAEERTADGGGGR